MANESDRSKVVIFTTNSPSGNFTRPNHNDFATTAELRQRKFTGWRNNSVTGNAELWIEGNLDMEVTAAQIMLDPDSIEKAHVRRFGLD